MLFGVIQVIKIAICDDSKEDRERIKGFLKTYFQQRNEDTELTEYEDGSSLLDDYADKSVTFFDVIFLDILMKKSQGINVAKSLREFDKKVCIVFTTDTGEFAMSGYAVHAYGYLIKPIAKADAFALMDDFVQYYQHESEQIFLIKRRSIQEKVPYKDIIFMESQNPYVYIHLKDKSIHRIHAKLKDVENEVEGKRFIRCHQSFIINLSEVQKADKTFHMSDGTQIPIRRQRVREMKERYSLFLKRKQ